MSFQYELIEPIATTPFGTVFRGCNYNQQSEVAVLELFEHYREDRDTLNDIWHAIQPICNLKHDFLVPVIDMDKARGWIVMEMRGENLASIIRKSPLPQNVVRTLLRNILELIDFYEANKFVHGDIRPEMLTLPQHPHGKSLDQLRVRLFPSLGVSLCGEIPLAKRDAKYLAPEMLNHQFGNVSSATDLYCLGFTALELLAGTKFDSHFQRIGQDSNTAWHFWHGNVSEQLPTPREIIPDLADDLNKALAGMLKKSVSERPKSAKEILALLADFEPEAIPSQLIAGHIDYDPRKLSGGGETDITTDFSTTKLPEPSSLDNSSLPDQAKRTKMQTTDSNSPQPWSKEWCDQQINKPHVFAGLAAVFLIVAVIIGLFLRSLKGDGSIPVTLDISPADAIVMSGKKELEPDEDGNFRLLPGEYPLKISADGYEPFVLNINITLEGSEPVIEATTETGKTLNLDKTIKLKKTVSEPVSPPPPVVASPVQTPVETPPVVTPPAPTPIETPPVVTPPVPASIETPPVVTSPVPTSVDLVPTGFRPIGSEKDEKTGLYLMIESDKLAGVAPLRFVLIQPGSFTFGVAKGEKHWGELDGVTVKIMEPFYMATTEIDRKQYQEFLAKNVDRKAPADFAAESGNLPVTGVSHDDAAAFCQWIDGRLPTEQEWEYAARYPTFDAPFPWGNAPATTELVNAFETNKAAPTPVEAFEKGKTPAGLLNMIGNVSEWCADPYQVGFSESKDDPVFKNSYVAKSPSFTAPLGPEVRVTWRAPVPAAGAKDVGLRPVVGAPHEKGK